MHTDDRHSILFVSSTLSGGGAERFVSTVLAHLDRDRFAPSLALLRDEIRYPLPPDVPVEVLGKQRPWQLPTAIRKLARHVDAARPDLMLSAFAHPNLVTGCALGLARHAPRWLARVSSPPRATDPLPLRPLMRRLYARCDGIVVNASALRNVLADAYGAASDHLPNATDFARIDAASREPVAVAEGGRLRVVAAGRLVPEKRFDLLLEALAGSAHARRTELVICGDGPQRAALEAEARRLAGAPRVLLPGFVENPFAWFASADLFALSSDVEGLPNALIEAQGLGLPAVATDCPTGPAEVIEADVTGLLVPPGDARAFAAALDALLSDADRRARMGRAAREHARSRYDAAPVVRRLERLLEGISAG